MAPQIVGPGKDAARIPGMDMGVDEASGWEFAGHAVRVLEVPGHTRGAITFVIDGNAFTGDTLFALGCGRLFEGDAADDVDQPVETDDLARRDHESIAAMNIPRITAASRSPWSRAMRR